jgi:hypothetical protein
MMHRVVIAWLAFEASTALIGFAWPWCVIYLHAPNLFHIVPDFMVQP